MAVSCKSLPGTTENEAGPLLLILAISLAYLKSAHWSFSNFWCSLLCRGVTFLHHFKLCWSSGPGAKPVAMLLLPWKASEPVSQGWLSSAERAGIGWDKKRAVEVLSQLGFKRRKRWGTSAYTEVVGASELQGEPIFKCIDSPKYGQEHESCCTLIT